MRRIISSQIGDFCFESLFVENNFTDVECLKVLISKFVGYGIVAGAMLYKIPQILKIVNNWSVEGLSLSSIVLELIAFAIVGAYGFQSGLPFSSYGETVMAAIQNFGIILLFLSILKKPFHIIALSCGTLLLFLALVISGFIPDGIITACQLLTTPLIILCRFPQITTNFNSKSTGQLSIITVALQVGGTLIRLLTLLVEKSSVPMLITQFTALVLNLIIAIQMLLYWNSAPKAKVPTRLRGGPKKEE